MKRMNENADKKSNEKRNRLIDRFIHDFVNIDLI